MWWTRTPKITAWDFQRIQARLEALESRPLAVDYAVSIKNVTDSALALIDRLNGVDDSMAGLLAAHAEIIHAVDEGISRTERAERRIRTTVRSAKKKLADSGVADDALDAEAEGLRLVDGEPEPGRGVPPVRESVVDAEPADSSIPGVSQDTLRKVRGY